MTIKCENQKFKVIAEKHSWALKFGHKSRIYSQIVIQIKMFLLVFRLQTQSGKNWTYFEITRRRKKRRVLSVNWALTPCCEIS